MYLNKIILPITLTILLFSLNFVQANNHMIHQTSYDISETDNDWWPMFQHDLSHSAYSTSLGPETNNILWSYQTDRIINSPSVINGKIYFGTNHIEGQIMTDSFVFCLDLYGNIIWQFTAKGNLASSPTIVNEKVYIGSDTGNMYCLDAENGDLIWRVSNSNSAVSSPLVTQNKVVFESLDGNMYCLDTDTGETIWIKSLSIDILSTPIIVDGEIYVNNYCLSLSTGQKMWTTEVGLKFLSSPSHHNGKILVGSQDEKFYCVDANTGDKIWKYYIGSMTWETSPAVAYENVYVGNHFGFIYCLNADTGEYIWSTKMSARAVSSPSICDGKLYIGSVDNNIYCLDAFTGEKIWNYSHDRSFSSPAIANNKVYSSSGKTLFCFGLTESSDADLDCTGSININNVETESIIETTFTIANVGQNGSLLNWEIESYPDWGEWSFIPSFGEDLKPSDGTKVVEVCITAPNIKDNSFSGVIKVVNTENTDDFELIGVSLSTQKNRQYTLLNDYWLFTFLRNLTIFDYIFI